MLLLLLPLACSSVDQDTGPAGADDSGTPTVPVDRGPTTIAIDGDPNGLWWDGVALTIADDDNNRILTWTDADGLGLLSTLPEPSPDGAGLGQPVLTSDGTVVVPRFGYGTAGDVVTLAADGSSAVVPGLDTERRRIGLAVAADGTLYDGWFISGEAGRVGEVNVLDLAGSETPFLTGLGKPVGVLVVGDTLYVSDQDAGEILATPLRDPGAVEVHAQVEDPDLLGEGPDGSLYTGSSDGSVRQVGTDGSVSTFASGYQEVRGVAYDAANRRLFFVDHDGDDSDGLTNFLQILPVGD